MCVCVCVCVRTRSGFLCIWLQNGSAQATEPHCAQELCWILVARLAAIREAWQDKRLQKAGVARAEVERLIMALFEDTTMRRSVLGTIPAYSG